MELLFNLLLWTVILPSGTVLGIPVKMILFLFCVMLLIKGRYVKVNNNVKIILFVMMCMLFWCGLSISYGYLPQDILTSLKVYISLVSTLVIFNIVLSAKKIKLERLMLTLKYIFVFMLVQKIIIELLYINALISFADIQYLFNNVFDSDVMLLKYQFAGIEITRISTVNDNIVLVLFGLLLWDKKNSVYKNLFIILATCIYSMINFSRLNLIQFAGTVLIIYISEYIGKLNKKKLLYALSSLAFILFLLSIKYEIIIEPLIYRFTGIQVEYSDSIRTEQLNYLLEGVLDSPIIGHGLGSYIPYYVRSEIIKSSYELEYLSFLYQFGLFGFILIIGSLIIVAFSMCKTSLKGLKLLITYNFLIWVLKPCFNPNFLSSISAMTIIILCIFKCYYENEYKYHCISKYNKISDYEFVR